MLKTLRFALIIVNGAFGAFLLAGYGSDDRDRWWLRSHLKAIQPQLAVLKTHLRAYRDAHGRYPANDEGLGVLDNFEARFEVPLYRRTGAAPEYLPQFGYDAFGRDGWQHLRMAMQLHRGTHGRAPRSMAELRPIDGRLMLDDVETAQARGYERIVMGLAIGKGGEPFLISSAGVLSPWHVPYVYENRRGCDASAFAGSPAERDKGRRYSVEVDDGVYVYSVGGEVYAGRLWVRWWEDMRLRLVGGGMAAVALGVAVWPLRRQKRWFRRAAAATGLGAMAAGALVTGMFQATCYIMSPISSYRDPAIVARQKQLLDRYREAGVIGEAAYRRALRAHEPAPAATQPDGQR